MSFRKLQALYKQIFSGRYTVASIVANCHYTDMREGYLREKEDIRKAKAKAYRERRKARKA